MKTTCQPFKEFRFNGKAIECTESVRDLGLIVDSNLAFKEHVSHICQRVVCAMNLKSHAQSSPEASRYLLYMAFVQPYVDSAFDSGSLVQRH